MSDGIRLDVNNMMADCIGYQYGIDSTLIDDMEGFLKSAHAAVEAGRGTGMRGWMELPYNQGEVVKKIKAVAESVRGRYKTFVVLGIGGSALGPSAVHQALNHIHYNELPDGARRGPRLYVEDNIDPERMAALLDVIDLRDTCFNVITKSGGTAETMSQYLILREALERAVGDKYGEQIIATTSESRGNLIKIARAEGYETFYIPEGVGGRFSELCPVGLLAAAVCGIDIEKLLEGARDMDARLRTDEVWDNPALLEAALMYVAMQDMGVNVSVMMPYADSLRLVSDWYGQLWAESLGKSVTRKGMAVNVGQTPAKALGVTDQHSQLQLYTEGPYDKVVTFLKVENFRAEVAIPSGCADIPDVSFLGGKSLGGLIEAERQGTEYALVKAGRMNQTITLPEVNEYTVGQLLYFFEMVTAYAGELLDIDAFNQPGVEESKVASYAVLGNEDEKYAAKRAEMSARPAPNAKYIIG